MEICKKKNHLPNRHLCLYVYIFLFIYLFIALYDTMKCLVFLLVAAVPQEEIEIGA
jgi:hypothetical protein